MRKDQIIKIINQMEYHLVDKCGLCGEDLRGKPIISRDDLIVVLTGDKEE